MPAPTWMTPSMIPAELILILIFLLTMLMWCSSRAKGDVLEKMSPLSTWRFMAQRHDFVTRYLKQNGGRPIRFKVLHYTVLAFSGEKARRKVFAEPGLDPLAAQRAIGLIPALKEPDREKQAEDEAHFAKSILRLIHRDRLSEALPGLVEDIWRLTQRWGNSALFDPFEEMNDIVFQTTLRIASCRDIYENRKTVMELQKNFLSLERNATPFSILLPWFPGPAQLGRLMALISIARIFGKAAQRRRAASDSGKDGIDVLISQGDDHKTVTGSMIGFVLAGTVTTALMASWAVIYLGSHPHWKQRATSELRALVEKHSDNVTDEAIHNRLCSIPIKAWEDEIPLIDLVIRETIRLIMFAPAIRRNMGRDVVIDDVEIRKGQFAVYSIADAHLNPDIYTNPSEFDPERYLPGREEDRKEAFAYIGWGAGRHPCLGMKLAILELKIILAVMLLGFEWKLVDRLGTPLNAAPIPDRNNPHTIPPLGDPCYIKFQRTKEL